MDSNYFMDLMGSLFQGILVGGGYGIVGGLVSLVVSQAMYGCHPRDLPPRQYYAMAILWPIVMVAFVVACMRTLATDVWPILRGPTKHERSLAEIERLEAEELAAMESWERKHNASLREPSLSRWEQEAEDDR